jgi:hypothetical protein
MGTNRKKRHWKEKSPVGKKRRQTGKRTLEREADGRKKQEKNRGKRRNPGPEKGERTGAGKEKRKERKTRDRC